MKLTEHNNESQHYNDGFTSAVKGLAGKSPAFFVRVEWWEDFKRGYEDGKRRGV